jgi:hypothetical protein
MTTHDDGEGPVERRVGRHTPGPWEWKDGEYADTPELAAPTGRVCWFGNDEQYYPTCGEPPNEADMTLIAAAPELLECLRAVELLFAPHCKDSTQADWLDRTQRLLRRLGAA